MAYRREHAAAAGRDRATIETHLDHNINVNEDQGSALEESRRFLDEYSVPQRFSREAVASWVATGSPEQCVEHLRVYEAMGFGEVTLRITSWDQMGPLERVVAEALSHFAA